MNYFDQIVPDLKVLGIGVERHKAIQVGGLYLRGD
jgi:hypothetical protein